jgi:hypothetical protein
MYPFLPHTLTRRNITADEQDGGVDVLTTGAATLPLGVGNPSQGLPACPSFVGRLSVCITPVNQIEKNKIGIKIFPNPISGDILNVEVQEDINEHAHIKLFDSLGKEIFNKGIHLHGGEVTLKLPSNIPDGFYYLSFYTKDTEVTEKIFITKNK